MISRLLIAAGFLSLSIASVPAQDKTDAKSKAGFKIIFISNRENKVNQIFSMDPDGSAVEQITKDADPKLDPAPSADGKQIAYIARKKGKWELCVADIDGKNEKQVTATEKGSNVSPCWYPDGKKILYASSSEGQLNFYTIAPGDKNPKPEKLKLDLPKEFASADRGYPALSPDGKKIAFVTGTDGKDDSTFEIFVADEKGKCSRLTENKFFDSTPSWSADGKKLAFVSNRDGNDEIYVMDADGKNVKRLTDDPATDTTPIWTPDGQRIIFVSSRDGNLGIYSMKSDGSDLTRLAQDGSKNSSPRICRRKEK